MRVLLVPNPSNPRSIAAAADAAGWLVSRGYQPLLAADDAEACGLGRHAVARTDIDAPGLAVALGGDGTILKTVHLLGDVDTPVLGVNLGRLGFLSGAQSEDLKEALAAAVAGEVGIERRQTLFADVAVGGRHAGRYRALNEVFIGRGAGSRVVELEIRVNGVALTRLVCDGVIIASATGSTAYALSAGGPIVSPDVRGMVLVPVAPHTLRTRAIVLGPSDHVEVVCPNPARADACVSIDGDQVPCRRMLDAVTVGVADHDVRLLRMDGRSFYDVLADSFLGD